MEYIKFGTTDLSVSPMGLGCLRMSEQGGVVDDVESIATLHMAFDLGINFLDTSANYGQGHNHRLIASALKGRQEKVIVHTKSGSPRTPDSSGSRSGSSPEYLTRVCEESLQRLELETLDIFCMSRVDPDIPIEESIGAMARLVEHGKIRYISLSEASADSIQRANKIHPVVSLQMEYSLWSRDPESGNIQACRDHNMGFMAYSPLGRGFLAGQFRALTELDEGDARLTSPRFQPENFQQNLQLLTQLEDIANEKSATLAQLALAWLMAQGNAIIPIPGAKSRNHLEENVKAIDIKLTPEDLARLDAIMPPGAAAGRRLDDEQLSRVNI